MNEQNLQPSKYKLSQEEAKKGGINSGKSATNLLPDGIDYLADMDVRNCVKILSKRMDTQFIQKFTNKGKNVNIAA